MKKDNCLFCNSPKKEKAKMCRTCYKNGHNRKPIEERIEKFVEIDNGCWMWLGSKDKLGYGRILRYEGSWLAHRIVYELLIGSIPSNLELCHTCDIPSCVNPFHKFIGTQKENIQDAAKKGRMHKAYA